MSSNMPRQDDDMPVKISRQVSSGMLTGVMVAIILAVLGSGIAIRDGLMKNTAAVEQQAQATAQLTMAVQQLQARFAAKDLTDAKQDFRLDDYEKRILSLENQKPLRLR
jgi:type II secretory pathway component PulJ